MQLEQQELVLMQMVMFHPLTLVVQDVDQNLNQQVVEEVAVHRQAQTVVAVAVNLVAQVVVQENMDPSMVAVELEIHPCKSPSRK